MKKNYYAKVLALTVAASMVSVPAFAAEENINNQNSIEESKIETNKRDTFTRSVNQISVSTESELRDAIAKATGTKEEPTEISITGDIYLSSTITIEEEKYISINGNGHTLSRTSQDWNAEEKNLFIIKGSMGLNNYTLDAAGCTHIMLISGGHVEANNTNFTGSYNTDTYGAIGINHSGSMIMVGGSIHENESSSRTAVVADGGTFEMTDTKIYNNVSHRDLPLFAIYDKSTQGYICGAITLNSGEIYNNKRYYNSSDTIRSDLNSAIEGYDTLKISGSVYVHGNTVSIDNGEAMTRDYCMGLGNSGHRNEDGKYIASNGIKLTSALNNNVSVAILEYNEDTIERRTLFRGVDGYTLTEEDLKKVDIVIGKWFANDKTYSKADLVICLNKKENTIEAVSKANITFIDGENKTIATYPKYIETALGNTPTKEGYVFVGWNTQKDGSGTSYEDSANVTLDEDITLYAQWRPGISVDGTATKAYEKVYDGEEVTLSVPAVDNATYTWKKGETNVGTNSNTLKLKDVADSGRYTCTVTVDEETETREAVNISITKAPITLTSDRQSMKGAGTVTLTVNGIAENEKNSIAVTCDDTSVNVNDSNGTYTAYLPNATKTYTFTVTNKGEGFNENNYVWDGASCTVDVTRKKSSSSSSDTAAPTYGVSTGKTENGKISVTPAKAEAGEKVTIKATPDSGYQLDKVTVKDKDNSNVKLTKVNDNEYTFTMPKGKVSVDATFVQKDAADDNSAAEKSKVIKLQIGSRIVNVDNEAVIYDAAPVIRNDRTLVPIRIVTETLGGKVDWNGVTKEVTLNIDGKEIKMTIGKTLEKYGVAPVIIDGRTFVPVRFVADELGATVAWDDATKTVTITKIEK